VDAKGTWSCAPTTALSNGQHTVSVAQTDAAGDMSQLATVTFGIQTLVATVPVELSPSVTAPTAPTGGAVAVKTSWLLGGVIGLVGVVVMLVGLLLRRVL
jgi:hypothetical protein